jgi:hypothetical protein
MKKDEFFWNSTKNDGFEAIYYNGYLTFGNQEVGVKETTNTNTAGVYMSGNMLRLKGLETADIKVYSTIGQLVKSGNRISQLNLSDLKSGIYLVRLNNIPTAFKVMKR